MSENDDEMTMNTELVKKLTAERGWVDAELARRMGMSKSTVSRAMSGEKLPGRVFIARLRRVFPERRDDLFIEKPPEHHEVGVISSGSTPDDDAAA